MAEQKLTPEEKLLRIIESPQAGVQRIRPQRRVQDFKFLLNYLKAKYSRKVKQLLNLKTANAILMTLAATVTFFLGLDFWIGLPRVAAIQRLEIAAKKTDIGDFAIGYLDPLETYLQEIQQRNIFALIEPQKKETVDKETLAKEELASLVKGLKLVGIIWSEAPQAIIEDAADSRTYLLNRGGQLKEARVKEILQDSVILSYDNQEVELR